MEFLAFDFGFGLAQHWLLHLGSKMWEVCMPLTLASQIIKNLKFLEKLQV